MITCRSKIVRSESETRENFIVVQESTGDQYRFGMPGTFLAEARMERIGTNG